MEKADRKTVPIDSGYDVISLSVKYADADYVQRTLNDLIAGKCKNGAYVLPNSIVLREMENRVINVVMDTSLPFMFECLYSFREFKPITGEVYDMIVQKIDQKGTVLRMIDSETGTPFMIVTVLDKYSGEEGDVVPVLLRFINMRNGQREISALGEFVDAP